MLRFYFKLKVSKHWYFQHKKEAPLPPVTDKVEAVPSVEVLPDPSAQDIPEKPRTHETEDEEDDIPAAKTQNKPEQVIKAKDIEADNKVQEIQNTPKPPQQPAVPKLKTPLQPVKVTEFEKQEQKMDSDSAASEEKPESGELSKEKLAEIEKEISQVVEPEIRVSESEKDEMNVTGESEEKVDVRYSQLSEEEDRLRRHSEMSEVSDDRVRFMIGETESESGSHLDLKGDDARSESISIVSLYHNFDHQCHECVAI